MSGMNRPVESYKSNVHASMPAWLIARGNKKLHNTISCIPFCVFAVRPQYLVPNPNFSAVHPTIFLHSAGQKFLVVWMCSCYNVFTDISSERHVSFFLYEFTYKSFNQRRIPLCFKTRTDNQQIPLFSRPQVTDGRMRQERCSPP